MSKSLVIQSVLLSLIGLAPNRIVDRDNVYDLTLSALFGLGVIFTSISVFTGGTKTSKVTSTLMQQLLPRTKQRD